MSALFVERGYGQVEANRLTGIITGDLESQAPAYEDNTKAANAAVPISELENGMFLCVIPDKKGYAGASMGRVAVLPGNAPATAVPKLVYSEKKMYDEREGYCDFVDRASNKVDGLLYPRLVGLTPDTCVFTTNTINNAKYEDGALTNPAVGDIFYVGDDGYLTKIAATNTVYQFCVDKVYTMPDGQTGLKFQCQRFVDTKG